NTDKASALLRSPAYQKIGYADPEAIGFGLPSLSDRLREAVVEWSVPRLVALGGVALAAHALGDLRGTLTRRIFRGAVMLDDRLVERVEFGTRLGGVDRIDHGVILLSHGRRGTIWK